MNRLFWALAATVALAGCRTTRSAEPVVLQLGDRSVPASEFRYVYEKNNADKDDAYSAESVREYLDLYTNFKLKVIDAEAAGLDTTEAFRQELEVYKKQLAQPYLTETEVTEKLVQQAYDRLGEEVNASHLLISVGADALPKDTLEAYRKAMSLREQVLAGADFAALAREHSQDPSVARNDGDLGYFTSLQMVYPFEEAAFTTPVGEISEPVRTRFGYHLIKVQDRREARPKLKTAHIMLRANAGMPAEDSILVRKKIDEIYQQLRKGADWNTMVRQFSEDQGSIKKNGALPVFGTGSMIPSFEEAAYALTEPGDFSEPVQTPYGWHIVKLIERVPLASFEEMEPEVRRRVSKDSRADLNRQVLLQRLREENNFTAEETNIATALAAVDSTYLDGKWSYNQAAPELSQTLFSLTDTTYTRGNFFAYLESTQRPRRVKPSLNVAVRQAFEKYRDDAIVAYEEAHLAEKYEDYRMLVREYREGILLFSLMDEKVWSKALEDTLGLEQFFQDSLQNYQWEQRARATVYSATSPEVMQETRQQMAKGIFPTERSGLTDVTFEPKTAELTEAARNQLQRVAREMRRDTTLFLDVIGHADADEAAKLAAQRAQAVASFLQESEVPSQRLIVKNFGQRNRVVAQADPQNKRVSFQAYTTAPKALERLVNGNDPLALQVTEGVFEAGDNPVIDSLGMAPGEYNFQRDGRVYYVEVHEVLPPRPKTLDEARGLVIADYQNYLEKQWVASLRQRYPVVVNEAAVERLIQSSN